MRTALSFSPPQARAPKGTRVGGQWVDTPGDALEGLETYAMYQADPSRNTPPDFDPFEDDTYHRTHDRDSDKTQVMHNQYVKAESAYLSDTGHAEIADALRSGNISPPRGGATYGDAGYFDPHREDGANVNMFTHEVDVLGDGSGVVHALDGEMTENWLTQPATLYRGMTVNDPSDFEPGTRWYEAGYTSTTYSPDLAMEFAKMRAGQPSVFDNAPDVLRDAERTGKPVLFRIIVPSGTRFVPGAESVGEIILDRGGHFEVVENRGDMVTIKYEQFDDAPENKAKGSSDAIFDMPSIESIEEDMERHYGGPSSIEDDFENLIDHLRGGF